MMVWSRFWIAPATDSVTVSLGLLLLRLIVGVAFILHGWPKIQNPFGWLDTQLPPLLQALAALSEYGGGLTLLAGFLTPFTTLGLFATMTVAVVWAHLLQGHPFVGATPESTSYELALVYWACALLIALTGPGRFSLDYYLFSPRE
jgi:putative oxidoreductase